MNASDWMAKFAGVPADWRVSIEFRNLPPEEQRTVLQVVAHNNLSDDLWRKRTAQAAMEAVVLSGFPTSGINEHIALEVAAVAQRGGKALPPGAPVPGCACSSCTGVESRATAKSILPQHANSDIVEAARVVPITDVARRLGLDGLRASATGGYARCPFHDDHTPSLHLNEGKRRAFCNPCGRSWDGIALVAAYLNLSFREAVLWMTT
jgi:hypothetical protein